ncbi:hypothetical protein [Acetobacterium sp.]|jgi:hypothetical protein|uniref:IS1096 element passenger TnpR family protein n=1 Tax=Acetobacterium sp. TaxID=1872094 RepID=UPI000CC5F6DB|nr:hypothetical protein [Acetobacterium sp.]MDO9493647.1 hypothetical protein [Acetobacterium sp.]PKM75472.1 MAG: hypothetical protein CVU92_01135 [Firmicutes bacterium HGW-Firmicutes-17]
MNAALTAQTGINPYKYQTFELKISLDLEIYTAICRLIVPAALKFDQLHRVTQNVFGWDDYHLYDFAFFNGPQRKPVVRLVPFEENLEYDADAILMASG